MNNMREVIALCLEDEEDEVDSLPEFVGVQRIQL
jgi:predicted RNase H-like HicB family nuclease